MVRLILSGIALMILGLLALRFGLPALDTYERESRYERLIGSVLELNQLYTSDLSCRSLEEAPLSECDSGACILTARDINEIDDYATTLGVTHYDPVNARSLTRLSAPLPLEITTFGSVFRSISLITIDRKTGEFKVKLSSGCALD